MHLHENEHVSKTIRRHITPFFFAITKIVFVSLPFYIIAFFIGKNLGMKFSIIIFLVISLFLGFFIVYVAITYVLDRLIITNERVVFVNWKSLWRKDEFEADLIDIQDIRTREKGFFARFRLLDYGLVEIETASSSTVIIFDNAPDPEGIKSYLLSYIKKRGGIKPPVLE